MLINSLSSFQLNTPEMKNSTADSAESFESSFKKKMTQSIFVNISEQGKTKAREAEKNKDIEESGLPDNIKDLLKYIRELKTQISEKQAELQKVMADKQQSEEEWEVKIKQLQSELVALNGALVNANLNLRKALEDSNLSDEQRSAAASLALK